ncbi:MAG: RecQ family ATP-dependent DNA helicase [Paracoccaceae bacterium]|nr:RecQ family ATP-dependent DNA helicase [Paracoccaceae bacterium]
MDDPAAEGGERMTRLGDPVQTATADGERAFRPDCVSIDLEVGRRDGRIHGMAAVHGRSGRSWRHSGSGLAKALDRLDRFASQASFILGHNLIEFDIRHLEAVKPDLRLLDMPRIDTLRLNPLSFPAHPYHSLVKHYQDAALRRVQINDPELDSRIALQAFANQVRALEKAPPDLLAAWHWLVVEDPAGKDEALDAMFTDIRNAPRPPEDVARDSIRRRLRGTSCETAAARIGHGAWESGWALAYALAWLSVAGGKSVIPPWVRHQFPETGQLVRRLRDRPCAEPGCAWCSEQHDAIGRLKRFFGYEAYRPEPRSADGRPMQQAIVEETFAGRHCLGILPTGTGKSLCYQIPALARFERTGALTVVISPLVALMADQIAGLQAKGIGSCVTINGQLSMPERADAIDKVRLGEAGILLIAPEQLRSRTVSRAIEQREVGGWVLDEAHCLSKWGQDFRPDYRYVGRFIRKRIDRGETAVITCLTATAKPDVCTDIVEYFCTELGIGMRVFDGGAERSNLNFQVIPTTPAEKYSTIRQVLADCLRPDDPGGAIVYCAFRRTSEEVAEFLREKDIDVRHFHAGMRPDERSDVQRRFINGELRAIAATNAFGMGIDKPDVRLVVHADMPGSLENYLQEAGRAGRDREPARCVLLFAPEDVERQFSLMARSRLRRVEIHGILMAVRNLRRRKRVSDDLVVTAGEILLDDEEGVFERDSATDDTRVRTAVAWLEESRLISRHENVVQVFPSSLLVSSVDEARDRMKSRMLAEDHRQKLLRIVEVLIEADPDRGVTTDELMMATGLGPEKVRQALYQLEGLGIANNDTVLTAFVHTGIARSSRQRLAQADELECELVAHMREAAPDLDVDETSPLNLRVASQRLRDQGLKDPLPQRLFQIISGIAADGRGEDGASGSLSIRKRDAEVLMVTLKREWEALEETAARRREAARLLLDHLLGRLPRGVRGTDLLVETTVGDLLRSITSDMAMMSRIRSPEKLLDRALLWLHELEVIRLHKGLVVFRSAMTLRLPDAQRRGFSNADYKPLQLHYDGQVLQVHVMAEYAERGIESMSEATRLALDYFDLEEGTFLEKWLPGRGPEIGRQTTRRSWQAIVDDLGDPVQKRIVADDREQTHVLVLAGPGSGKTRVLVHRIAYLVRVRREPPRGILALAYNRHAAVEIQRRLAELIGDDSRQVTVMTCHGFAMRLVGASFADSAERPGDDQFREVIRAAIRLLQGDGLPPDDADAFRERLLGGYRWILVDEYQDIDSGQYDLISAIAGRTKTDANRKLTVFAVGDDDQNIYGFSGASVEFIRRFKADYGPKPVHLVENYRSTAHIVAAANAVIEPAASRMKVGYPIRVDKDRAKDPKGGAWDGRDPVARGRVQILAVDRDPVAQTQAVMFEFERLSKLDPDWDWSRAAVIARTWDALNPVRAFCETRNIPVQLAREEIPSFWLLRETLAFVKRLRAEDARVIDGDGLHRLVGEGSNNRWQSLIRQAVDEYVLENSGQEVPTEHFVDWLAEWGREVRRRQRGLLLVTAHSAKGLEFDHVAVLDGEWDERRRDADPDESRRLIYVAMTRARRTLVLARFHRDHPVLASLTGNPSVIVRPLLDRKPGPAACRYLYRTLVMHEVNLGFAGRKTPGHRVHRDIAALQPGDAVILNAEDANGRRDLCDRFGNPVGRLAAAFRMPDGMRFRSGHVHAVIGWNREISEESFQDGLRCDSWEVVVPELVFEPVT